MKSSDGRGAKEIRISLLANNLILINNRFERNERKSTVEVDRLNFGKERKSIFTNRTMIGFILRLVGVSARGRFVASMPMMVKTLHHQYRDECNQQHPCDDHSSLS